MQSALDRHLRNAGKKHSILRDREFEKSRQQLEAKAREFRVKGYGKRKNASHALNEEDEEFLWQSGQLGEHYCVCVFLYTLLFLDIENWIVSKY